MTPKFSIKLRKGSAAIFSSMSTDWEVVFNDVRVGLLQEKDGLYMGIIPDHKGAFHSFPDAPIRVWAERCAEMMRRASDELGNIPQNAHKVKETEETIDPDVVRIRSGIVERRVQAKSLYFAAKIFGSMAAIPMDYCAEAKAEPAKNTEVHVHVANMLRPHVSPRRPLRPFLDLVGQGECPNLTRNDVIVLTRDLDEIAKHRAYRVLAEAMTFWINDAFPSSQAERLNAFLDKISEENSWAKVSFADEADGTGTLSASRRISRKIHEVRHASADDVATPLRDLMSACASLGEASPLRKIDQDEVSFFGALAYAEANETQEMSR